MDLVAPHRLSAMLNDPSSAPASAVLQILDIKPIANNRFTCMATDGSMKVKAMLPTDLVGDVQSGKVKDLGLIRVNNYTSQSLPNQAKALVITSCEVVCPALEAEISIKPDIKPKTEGALLKSAAQIVREEHGSAAPAARMGISRRVYPLMSLTPYQGNWTIKVRVTSKGPLRTYKNARGEGSVFNVELTDEDGTQIQATMFKEAADKFYSKFVMGKVYFISKGSLRMANKRFATVKNNYEMTLTASSEVEEAVGEDTMSSQIPLMKYNLVKIEDLGLQLNAKELFDVIGVVHSVSSTVSVRRKSDNTEVAKREMTIVDQSQKTVVVTLWNTLASTDGSKLVDMVDDAPVVLIKGLRANDYQGVSLSTSVNSILWINPDFREAQELRSWYDEFGRGSALTSIGSTLPGGNARSGSRSVYDDRAMLSSITQPSVGEGKAAYFSVQACISYIKPEQSMWYMACSACNRKVTEESSRYWCEGCQKHYDSCNRRYILLAKISDSSGEAWVSAFNEQAEEILGVPADKLAEIRGNQDDDQKLYQSHLKAAAWAPRVFRLSVAQQEYLGEKRQRVTIRSVHSVEWAAESKLLVEEIAKLS